MHGRVTPTVTLLHYPHLLNEQLELCMCRDLLGQKSRATTVMATGNMTSPRGYASINTSECIYSIPKPLFHFRIYTTASWSGKIKQKYKFDLLSSLKVDFFFLSP